MPYQSVNPATGELLQVFEEHTDRHMMNALAVADKTFRNIWSTMHMNTRTSNRGHTAS